MPLVKRKIKIYNSEQGTWRFIHVTNNPNKLVTLEGGGPTDEGFHWWRDQYTLEDGKIFCISDTESRDCDGPHMSHSMYYCEIPTKREDFLPPMWYELSYRQRDIFAEKMGY